MSVGLFLDLDGVLTPKAVNLQFAAMLGIEQDLVKLEDEYANGLIDAKQFSDRFVPLFRDSGFSQSFAREKFAHIVLRSHATELLQSNIPNTFIVSSSPSYYVDQLATKYGIDKNNVLRSHYSFDASGRLKACEAPAGSKEKAAFVASKKDPYQVTIGVGDSPEQDSLFMSLCTIRILMGGERRTYLHSGDLVAVHALVQIIRTTRTEQTMSGPTGSPEVPSACQKGVKTLCESGRGAKSVFIATPFREDARYAAAIRAVKEELERNGFYGWIASDLVLDPDLWTNVRCYMHACVGAVALLIADEKQRGESIQIRKDVYNPNVVAEAGYVLGLGKPLLLLKDKRIDPPRDWLGKVWSEFPLDNPATQIRDAVGIWIKQQFPTTS